MGKQIVRINEKQLHRLIAESVKRTLNELGYPNEEPDFSLSMMEPGTKLGTITVPAYEFCDVLNLPDEIYDKVGWNTTEWDFVAVVGKDGNLILKPSGDFVKTLNEILPGKGKEAMSEFTKYIQEKIENDPEYRENLDYFLKFSSDPNDFYE